jgi:hypothetical protein
MNAAESGVFICKGTVMTNDTLNTLYGQKRDLESHLRIFIGNDEVRQLLTAAMWQLGSVIALIESDMFAGDTAAVIEDVHKLIIDLDCRIINMSDGMWKAIKLRIGG